MHMRIFDLVKKKKDFPQKKKKEIYSIFLSLLLPRQPNEKKIFFSIFTALKFNRKSEIFFHFAAGLWATNVFVFFFSLVFCDRKFEKKGRTSYRLSFFNESRFQLLFGISRRNEKTNLELSINIYNFSTLWQVEITTAKETCG